MFEKVTRLPTKNDTLTGRLNGIFTDFLLNVLFPGFLQLFFFYKLLSLFKGQLQHASWVVINGSSFMSNIVHQTKETLGSHYLMIEIILI